MCGFAATDGGAGADTEMGEDDEEVGQVPPRGKGMTLNKGLSFTIASPPSASVPIPTEVGEGEWYDYIMLNECLSFTIASPVPLQVCQHPLKSRGWGGE